LCAHCAGGLFNRHGQDHGRVTDDIDPDNADRSCGHGVPRIPLEDVQALPHRGQATAEARARKQRTRRCYGRDHERTCRACAAPKGSTWSGRRKSGKSWLPKLRPQCPGSGIRSATGCRSGRGGEAASKTLRGERQDQREAKKEASSRDKFAPDRGTIPSRFSRRSPCSKSLFPRSPAYPPAVPGAERSTGGLQGTVRDEKVSPDRRVVNPQRRAWVTVTVFSLTELQRARMFSEKAKCPRTRRARGGAKAEIEIAPGRRLVEPRLKRSVPILTPATGYPSFQTTGRREAARHQSLRELPRPG